MTGTTRVRPKEFAARLGFSVPTLYRRMSTGEIKRPAMDGRCAYWTSDYVESVVKKSSGDTVESVTDAA